MKEGPDRVSPELDRLGIPRRRHGFFTRKHRGLAGLKIGQRIDVPPPSAKVKPHATFSDIAMRVGIRISVQRIAEGLYGFTRVSSMVPYSSLQTRSAGSRTL